MYASVCWYEYRGQKLDKADAQILIGALVGVSLKEIPPFVYDFKGGLAIPRHWKWEEWLRFTEWTYFAELTMFGVIHHL